MKNIKQSLLCAITASCVLSSNAFANEAAELNDLKQRVLTLEKKLSANGQGISNFTPRTIYGNEFNPSIGLILNGSYSSFSRDNSEIAGFAVGEEGERGSENFSLGESELNFSSNIDDKFFGSLTAAIVREEGQDKLELEEAFIQTTPGFDLPTGLQIKAGRALWNIGYLNGRHAHTDDFSNRPLPYRAFLNKAFNDDGTQISYLLPSDFYFEIGGGAYRGEDFPLGGGDGNNVASGYARIGGDIGQNQSWRLGVSALMGEAGSRASNEDQITFSGDSDLYIADLRYVFAPTGNSKNQEITLQGEYFQREEKGTYDVGAGAVDFDDDSSGYYAQAVYKFKPNWRIGARYSELFAADELEAGLIGSALDAAEYDPKNLAVMFDWSNSEFSRIRLQYDHEELSKDNQDDHITLQYIVSLGAHAAHQY